MDLVSPVSEAFPRYISDIIAYAAQFPNVETTPWGNEPNFDHVAVADHEQTYLDVPRNHPPVPWNVITSNQVQNTILGEQIASQPPLPATPNYFYFPWQGDLSPGSNSIIEETTVHSTLSDSQFTEPPSYETYRQADKQALDFHTLTAPPCRDWETPNGERSNFKRKASPPKDVTASQARKGNKGGRKLGSKFDEPKRMKVQRTRERGACMYCARMKKEVCIVKYSKYLVAVG